MKKKSFLIIIIIFLIISVAIILNNIFKINNKEITEINNIIMEDNKEEIVDAKNLETVKSATAYFTVQSCVNKYINYLSNKDKENIIILLDSDYLEKNNINEENVLEKIEEIPENTLFEAEKMYVEIISDDVNKYYVSGILKEDNFEQSEVIKNEFYIIINMDLKNMIFSVEPLKNGGIFNEKND